MGTYENMMYGLLGGGDEDRKRLQEQQRQAALRRGIGDFGAAMLAQSGYSQMPTTLGQTLGAGLMAGRQGYQQSAEQAYQQQQAMAKEQQMQQWLASLPPEMRQLAMAFPEKGAELQAGMSRDAAKARAEAANRAPPAKFRALTRAEKVQMGLDPNAVVQVNEATGEFKGIGGQTINVNTGSQAPMDPLSRVVTPQQRSLLEQNGVKLNPNIEYAWDKNNQPVPIKGTEPTDADKNAAAKSPQAQNAGMLLDQMGAALDEGLSTGWWNDIGGVPVGALSDQKKEAFNALKEQLSSQVRALFRIPGEGALSDSEQKQYGLTLPSLDKRPETNRVLIQNLKSMIQRFSPQQDQSDDDLIRKYL